MKIQHLSENSGLRHEVNNWDEYVIHRFIHREPNERYTMRDARHLPNTLDGALIARDVGLVSAEGGPRSVNGDVRFDDNPLKNFQGFPREIGGDLYAQNCELMEFKGGPIEVAGGVYLANNKLTSLKGIHKVFKSASAFDLSENNITEAVLGILLVEGCPGWIFDIKAVEDIVGKYLNAKSKRTMDDVLDCQEELIAAGYDEYAKL